MNITNDKIVERIKTFKSYNQGKVDYVRDVIKASELEAIQSLAACDWDVIKAIDFYKFS